MYSRQECSEIVKDVYWTKPKDAERIGFGKLGPEPNSIASRGQSHLGNVQKDSEFAELQRLRMKRDDLETSSQNNSGGDDEDVDWVPIAAFFINEIVAPAIRYFCRNSQDLRSKKAQESPAEHNSLFDTENRMLSE